MIPVLHMRRTFIAFLVLLMGTACWGTDFASERRAPVEPALLADTTAIVAGKPFTAALHLRLLPGWHTYWQNPGDSGLPVTLTWKLPPGWKAGALQWPLPHKFQEEGDMTTYGYENEVLLLVELTPPANLSPGETLTLEANAAWLACEKTCVPGNADLALTLPLSTQAEPDHTALFAQFRSQLPQTGPVPFSIRWEPGDTETLLKIQSPPPQTRLDYYPINPPSSHPERLAANLIRVPLSEEKPPQIRGMLISETHGQRQGWLVEANVTRTTAAPFPTATAAIASLLPKSAPGSSGTPQLTIPRALGFGFLGGFILNLMPCVLPVIALKIFGFLGQAGQSRQRVFRTGLAFVAGIFAWFLGLAALIVVARAAGSELSWAFQFQNPKFVTGMMLVIFVFALNLLGVFEVYLPGMGKLANLSSREGYTGTFLHGMFATLLATPCTAPFLAPALAFAFAQSAPVTLAMFASIAAGMSAPYLLLTAQPGWMSYLPKPGLWMVRLKQAFGFVMLGTVVWLLGVLGSQLGVAGAAGAVWILLGVGAACWVFGTWLTPNAHRLQQLLALTGMAALVGLGLILASLQHSNPAESGWQEWSPQRVESLQKEGRPVFIDFTADWCLNCKYNERFVIHTPPVREALKGWTTLKADWTRGDPRITQELKRLGRVGVPVYVVFPASGGPPEVLPEILTQRGLLDVLERAGKR
jgi:thiol:disulfide interchange protein DsbD